jgi:putative DNA primase/helicase
MSVVEHVENLPREDLAPVFNLTDAGNAQRFAAQHGADVRHCFARRAWLVWDGMRFKQDAGDVIATRAKATARSVYGEAAAAMSEDARKRLAAWAMKSESEPGIRRMLELAKSEPGIPVTLRELDRDPWLLNTPSGTVDLRTGQLRPHRREDLITMMTAAPYQPEARLPLFDAFLERVLPSPELRVCVQRIAGYACTGSTREEKLFLPHGPTAGGKSTLLIAVRRALGDYAATADATTFMTRRAEGGAPRDDLVKLIGRRLVVSSEVEDGTRFAESLVKTLFGGDDMSARALYERTVEFTPAFKLLIAANHRPRARDDDDALWRRIVEVPFTVSIPEAERDPAVKATLCDPAQAGAAVLAWAVAGAAAWYRDGLALPQAVKVATAQYREAMDPLRDFLTDRCVLEAVAEIAAKELRATYEEWAREAGVKHPVGGNGFAERLEARGCVRFRRHGGARWWAGIRLRTADDPDVMPDGDSSDSGARDSVNSPYTRAQEGSYENGRSAVIGVTTHSEACDCAVCLAASDETVL